MKRIFFLIVVLFGWINLTVGQINFNLSGQQPTCFGRSDGVIKVTDITGTTGNVNIRLLSFGIEIDNRLDVSPVDVIFSGLSSGNYTVRISPTGTSEIVQKAIFLNQPFDLQIVNRPVITHGSCDSKGTIKVSIDGGTPEFTYQLKSQDPSFEKSQETIESTYTFTNLDRGIYSLNVTDKNGCGPVIYSNLEVISPPELIGSEPITSDVLCTGEGDGQVIVYASGGTPPYTFDLYKGHTYLKTEWDVGIFSGLSGGDYTIVIWDMYIDPLGIIPDGCSKNISFTIKEPANKLEVKIDVLHENVCHEDIQGEMRATVSGGTSPFTYLWSTGATVETSATTQTISNLTGGRYTLTVEDDYGCMASDEAEINPVDELTVSSIVTHVTCNGYDNGAIELQPSGGTPGYFYVWDHGLTTPKIENLSPGTYNVIVTDVNNCPRSPNSKNSLVFTITQPDVLNASVTDKVMPSCS